MWWENAKHKEEKGKKIYNPPLVLRSEFCPRQEGGPGPEQEQNNLIPGIELWEAQQKNKNITAIGHTH